MRKLGLTTIGLASICLATGAQAASSFSSITDTATLDATDPISWVVEYTATQGTGLGATGLILFNFLGTNAPKTIWNFSYAVDNNSTAGNLLSEISSFGFNSTGVETAITTGVGNRFAGALNAGNFNGIGTRDVCLYVGPNCNGGASLGVTVPEPPVLGTFNLTYASALSNQVLGDFVMRWQSTGANGEGSASGTGGVIPPAGTPFAVVPEPSTWMMMIFGFVAVGYTLRRRRAYLVPQAV